MEQEIFKNKRESVLLGVKLSLSLIVVTLFIMLIGTIASCYLLILKQCSGTGAFFQVLFYTHCISSIIFAGYGINKIKLDGFANKWDILTGKREFDAQAKLILCAVACYGAFILTF